MHTRDIETRRRTADAQIKEAAHALGELAGVPYVEPPEYETWNHNQVELRALYHAEIVAAALTRAVALLQQTMPAPLD